MASPDLTTFLIHSRTDHARARMSEVEKNALMALGAARAERRLATAPNVDFALQTTMLSSREPIPGVTLYFQPAGITAVLSVPGFPDVYPFCSNWHELIALIVDGPDPGRKVSYMTALKQGHPAALFEVPGISRHELPGVLAPATRWLGQHSSVA